jgi:hypothetical protein
MHNQFAIRQHATGPVPVAKCIGGGGRCVCVGQGISPQFPGVLVAPPPRSQVPGGWGAGAGGGVVGVHHRLKAVEELRKFWAGRKEEEELLY